MIVYIPSKCIGNKEIENNNKKEVIKESININRIKVEVNLLISDISEIEKVLMSYTIYDDENHSNKLINISSVNDYKYKKYNKPIIKLIERDKILSYDFKCLYEFIYNDIIDNYCYEKIKLLQEILNEARSFLKDRKIKFYYNIGGINMHDLIDYVKKNTYNYLYNDDSKNQNYNDRIIQISDNMLCFLNLKENEKFINFRSNSCAAQLIIINNYNINDFKRFINDLNIKYRKYIKYDNLFDIVNEFISCLNIQSRDINKYYGNIFLEDYEKELNLWNNMKDICDDDQRNEKE